MGKTKLKIISLTLLRIETLRCNILDRPISNWWEWRCRAYLWASMVQFWQLASLKRHGLQIHSKEAQRWCQMLVIITLRIWRKLDKKLFNHSLAVVMHLNQVVGTGGCKIM